MCQSDRVALFFSNFSFVVLSNEASGSNEHKDKIILFGHKLYNSVNSGCYTNVSKWKIAHAKRAARAEIIVFVIKYANLWYPACEVIKEFEERRRRRQQIGTQLSNRHFRRKKCNAWNFKDVVWSWKLVSKFVQAKGHRSLIRVQIVMATF